jgi:hypothetical protein
MANLTDSVQGAIGQPASVRVGTVESANPLVISAQSTPFENVGVLDSYGPVVGDTVALLGQSSNSGSDPTSWLALGAITGVSAGMGVTHVLTAQATSSLNLTSVITDVPGATITFETARPNATVLVTWVADCNVIGATITLAIVRLNVDGVNRVRQILMEMPVAATAGRWTLAQQDVFTLANAGTHTLKLTGARSGGADNQIQLVQDHTNLNVTVYS